MREQREVPYIVIERESAGVGPFVVGALLGAGLALLFTPKSGEEMQRELREQARRLREAAEDRVRDAQRQLEERFEYAREGVQARFDGLREAMDTGRSAAVEARGELERRLERSKAAYRAGIDAAREAATRENGPERTSGDGQSARENVEDSGTPI